MTRVKICGLTRRQDAELAIDLGADALGFVLEPTSPRYVGDRPPDWVYELAPYTLRVAVFGVERTLPEGHPFDGVQAIRSEQANHGKRRFRVYRIAPRVEPRLIHDDVASACNAAQDADALVLDTASAKGFGGTGETLDWDVAAEIVRTCGKPVVLAGGLTTTNVAGAIAQVQPYAVDVSSGIESSPGIKDPSKLRDFIQTAKGM